MFYLIRGETDRASAETFDRAAWLVAHGWELTTRTEHRRRWQASDSVHRPAPIDTTTETKGKEIATWHMTVTTSKR